MSQLFRRTSLVAALFSFFAATTCAIAADASFERTLSFSGSPTVSISTGAGYIHVAPGPDDQFHVVGHVHANGGWLSGADPDARVKQIVSKPPVTQTAGIITIGRVEDHELYRNIAIDYDITTPRSTLLTTHTGSGDVQITGISGSVTAGSGSGTLRLTLSNSNDVHATTGSGSIHIEGVAGGLRANTGSGNIDVTGRMGTGWNLSSGSGSIRAGLPGNPRFSLNASTGSGSVHVDQPMVMQGSMNRHHVSGNVNGGGPTLRAATGSGSITISSNDAAAR